MTPTPSLSSIVSTIKDRTKTLIRMGVPQADIISKMRSAFGDQLDSNDIQSIVFEQVNNFPNYDFIQQIMRSKIVQEINSKTDYLIDPRTRKAEIVTKERIKDVLHPKLDISDKYIVCRFKYDPFRPQQIYKDPNGNWFYNLYQPPVWQEEYFYSDGSVPIEPETELPEIYDRFFTHLVAGDAASYQYTLDWMANALQKRNFCILTTIGVPGAGKGTLGEIMKNVVGESNFIETGNRILAERFNSQIKHRRIVSCDEFSVKDQKEEERLKVLVNNFLEIEAKGKDAEVINNHASFYFSSNNMDSLRLPSDDRRFSIVNLTDQRLTTVFDVKEIKALTDKDNIEKLARYLYYRPIDDDKMLQVFKSDRTEEVRAATLFAWHDWFLDEFAPQNAGKRLKVQEVSDLVEMQFGSKVKPGRGALQKLEKMYPSKFKIRKPLVDGRQVWCVEFPQVDPASPE